MNKSIEVNDNDFVVTYMYYDTRMQVSTVINATAIQKKKITKNHKIRIFENNLKDYLKDQYGDVELIGYRLLR